MKGRQKAPETKPQSVDPTQAALDKPMKNISGPYATLIAGDLSLIFLQQL